jgi:hypothetical protein
VKSVLEQVFGERAVPDQLHQVLAHAPAAFDKQPLHGDGKIV